MERTEHELPHITNFAASSYCTGMLQELTYHIISYHIISYHIISYHIVSYHIISYHR